MKKILVLGLAALMLFLICACGGDGDRPAAETEPVPEITPVSLASFALIRGEKADAETVNAVAGLYAELIKHEGGDAIQLMDDFLIPGTRADRRLPEILFGMTNRPESAQARAALPGYLDFSVGMMGQKLCIVANTPERLADAAVYFLENLNTQNGVLTYTGGQYVGRWAYPLADSVLDGKPVTAYTVVYPVGSAVEQAAAERLSFWFGKKTGHCLPVSDDGAPEQACEILVGNTSRTASVDPNGLSPKTHYIGVSGGKLVLSTKSAMGYNAILDRLEELLGDGQLKEDFAENKAYTAASLDGARVMFVGNSFTYYGGCTGIKNYISRNDDGYFKQVAAAMGDNVSVTAVTYGGAVLQRGDPEKCLYDIMTRAHPNHYGTEGEMDEFYDQDVVVIQQAGQNPSNNEESTRAIMALFPPETQFCLFIHHSNVECNHYYVLDTAKTLRDEGSAIYLPVGHLTYEVWMGKTRVPGATLKYNRESFCVNQEDDRYHPNYLNGYLTALTVYYALTGKSIIDCPCDFVSTSLQYYENGATTNYPDILASAADMAGLKQLVEQYVEQYN